MLCLKSLLTGMQVGDFVAHAWRKDHSHKS